MTTLIIIVVAVLAAALLAFTVASISIYAPEWKYYRAQYNKLKDIPFWYKNYDQLYDCNHPDNSTIIYYMYRGTIMIKPGVYLRNNWWFKFDPYTYYWLTRYKKFFKNLPESKIKEYRL